MLFSQFLNIVVKIVMILNNFSHVEELMVYTPDEDGAEWLCAEEEDGLTLI